MSSSVIGTVLCIRFLPQTLLYFLVVYNPKWSDTLLSFATANHFLTPPPKILVVPLYDSLPVQVSKIPVTHSDLSPDGISVGHQSLPRYHPVKFKA